jgi:outer membrane protein OmpA-like peptidoglycan-associated protein
LLVELQFATDSARPPEDAAALLGPAIEQANAAGGKVAIVGRGDDPALGLDRARAVAQLMLKLGLPPDRLALRGGGSGSEVQVFLLPSGPA